MSINLNDTIGSSYPTDPEDVWAVKSALSDLGYYEAPATYGMTPWPDTPMRRISKPTCMAVRLAGNGRINLAENRAPHIVPVDCHRGTDMTRLRTGLILLVGAALGYAVCRLLSQDACLDAGGAWDEGRHVCVGVSVVERSR